MLTCLERVQQNATTVHLLRNASPRDCAAPNTSGSSPLRSKAGEGGQRMVKLGRKKLILCFPLNSFCISRE